MVQSYTDVELTSYTDDKKGRILRQQLCSRNKIGNKLIWQ